MRATTTLIDAAGNTLHICVNNALPPMPAERHRTWVEMLIDGKKGAGMYEWHDDEFKAQLRYELLVKESEALGWTFQHKVPSP